MKAVVFDVGNVLLHWDPVLAWAQDDAARPEVEEFLARIGFQKLNLRADAGETFADLARAIADPVDRARFLTYPALYARTIAKPIEDSWSLLEALRARGLQIHAITNWSAETWPIGKACHPRLGSAFGVTVVSGQEGLIKPDPRIFACLCTRAGLAPDQALFIDDSLANVEGARAFGMQAHHFQGPEGLAADLRARGLLA